MPRANRDKGGIIEWHSGNSEILGVFITISVYLDIGLHHYRLVIWSYNLKHNKR